MLALILDRKVTSMLTRNCYIAIEYKIDRRIGAASAMMRSLYRSVVVNIELSQKRNFRFSGQSTKPSSPTVMSFG